MRLTVSKEKAQPHAVNSNYVFSYLMILEVEQFQGGYFVAQ